MKLSKIVQSAIVPLVVGTLLLLIGQSESSLPGGGVPGSYTIFVPRMRHSDFIAMQAHPDADEYYGEADISGEEHISIVSEFHAEQICIKQPLERLFAGAVGLQDKYRKFFVSGGKIMVSVASSPWGYRSFPFVARLVDLTPVMRSKHSDSDKKEWENAVGSDNSQTVPVLEGRFKCSPHKSHELQKPYIKTSLARKALAANTSKTLKKRLKDKMKVRGDGQKRLIGHIELVTSSPQSTTKESIFGLGLSSFSRDSVWARSIDIDDTIDASDCSDHNRGASAITKGSKHMKVVFDIYIKPLTHEDARDSTTTVTSTTSTQAHTSVGTAIPGVMSDSSGELYKLCMSSRYKAEGISTEQVQLVLTSLQHFIQTGLRREISVAESRLLQLRAYDTDASITRLAQKKKALSRRAHPEKHRSKRPGGGRGSYRGSTKEDGRYRPSAAAQARRTVQTRSR